MGSYIQLKSDVVAYSKRTDLDSRMDTFVRFSEAVINKELRVSEMEVIAPISYTAAFNDLPTDYLEFRGFSVNKDGLKSPVTFVTPDQIVGYQAADGYRNATIAAALHGGQIEIRPEPDAITPLTGEISYYAKLPTLVSNPTNDVLDAYPMLYLTAMLVQLYLFLQDKTEMDTWLAMYADQLQQANKTADDGRLHNPVIRVA